MTSNNKNFIIRQGLEVADDLLFVENDKIGIQTLSTDYKLDVRGDVSLTGQLLISDEVVIYTTTGTISKANEYLISGVKTSYFRVNDYIDDGIGGYINPKHRVSGINVDSISISESHGYGGTEPREINITITRDVFSGNTDEILTSTGPDSSPIWKSFSDFAELADLLDVKIVLLDNEENTIHYPIVASGFGTVHAGVSGLISIIPETGRLGVGTDNPHDYQFLVMGDSQISGVLTATSLNASNVTIGIGDTELIVDGDLNVTGIAGFGIDNIIIDGNTNTISIGTAFGTVISKDELIVGVDTNGRIAAGIVSASEFIGYFAGTANTSINLEIGSFDSEYDKYYPTFASGVGNTTLALTSSSIYIDPNTSYIGLGTDIPRFNIDLISDLGIQGRIYSPTAPYVYAFRPATITGLVHPPCSPHSTARVHMSNV